MTSLDSNMEDFYVEHGIASVDEEVTVYLSEKREDKETGIWNERLLVNNGDVIAGKAAIFSDKGRSNGQRNRVLPEAIKEIAISKTNEIVSDEEASLVGTLKISLMSAIPTGHQLQMVGKSETPGTSVLGDAVCVDGPKMTLLQ